jgi:hypothetical protein
VRKITLNGLPQAGEEEPMRKNVSLTMSCALLLVICTLFGCVEKDITPSEPVSASEVIQNIEPHTGEGSLTFDSTEALEAAILAENANEIYGSNLSEIAYYYLPTGISSIDSIVVTDRSVCVYFIPVVRLVLGSTTEDEATAAQTANTVKLEWIRNEDGQHLLNSKIQTAGLTEYSRGLYTCDTTFKTADGTVPAKSFYWAADGCLFNLDIAQAHFDAIKASSRIVSELTTLEKLTVPSAPETTEYKKLPLVGVDLETPPEELTVLAELAKSYSIPEFLDSTFLYNNRLFLDYAGGRALNPYDFIEFRDSVQVGDGYDRWNDDYLKRFVVDENGKYVHSEEGEGIFEWGPVFADLNGDGTDEVCYLQNNYTGSEFARLLVYEKNESGYTQKLCFLTGRDTFYLIENDGFVCLASTGPDYGKEEYIIYNEDGTGVYTSIEIRLLAFNADWSAEGIIIADGVIRPPADNTMFAYLAEEGRFERAIYENSHKN